MCVRASASASASVRGDVEEGGGGGAMCEVRGKERVGVGGLAGGGKERGMGQAKECGVERQRRVLT